MSASLGLIDGQYNYMRENGYEVIAISSAGTELDKLNREAGFKTYAVEMTRSITPVKDLKAVWTLYKIFRKERPLVVHTHTPKAGIVGMIAAALARVPHRFHTVAGLPLLTHTGFKRRILDFVEKLTYSCASMVYPNSKGLYQIILENGYAGEKKIKVIGNGSSNGINTSHFNPSVISSQMRVDLKNDLNIADTDFIYLFIGRLVGDKGINELVSSFNSINELYPHTKLLLVGSSEKHLDPLLPATEESISSNKSIMALGYQKDVRPYLAIADVFTFPSYREGFPNVLMQSCAMGVASIATYINGCNEIVVDGQTGVLVPPRNTQFLSEAMLEMLLNPELRKKIAASCRMSVVSRYEREYVWAEILKEYNFQIGQ